MACICLLDGKKGGESGARLFLSVESIGSKQEFMQE